MSFKILTRLSEMPPKRPQSLVRPAEVGSLALARVRELVQDGLGAMEPARPIPKDRRRPPPTANRFP